MISASRYPGIHMSGNILLVQQRLGSGGCYAKQPGFMFIQDLFYKSPLQQAELYAVKIIVGSKRWLLYDGHVPMQYIIKAPADRILRKQNDAAAYNTGDQRHGNS